MQDPSAWYFFRTNTFYSEKIPLLVQEKCFLGPTLGQREVAALGGLLHTIKEVYPVCRVEYSICLPYSRLFDGGGGASGVSVLTSRTSFTLLRRRISKSSTTPAAVTNDVTAFP